MIEITESLNLSNSRHGKDKYNRQIFAKYKEHLKTSRADSHQLLAYVFLTGVKKCGFIFPGTETYLKTIGAGENELKLGDGNTKYYELILSDNITYEEISKFL